MDPKTTTRRQDTNTRQTMAELDSRTTQAEAGPSRFRTAANQAQQNAADVAFDSFGQGHSSTSGIGSLASDMRQLALAPAATSLAGSAPRADGAQNLHGSERSLVSTRRPWRNPALEAAENAAAEALASRITPEVIQRLAALPRLDPSSILRLVNHQSDDRDAQTHVERTWALTVLQVQAHQQDHIPRPPIRVVESLGNLVEFHRNSTQRFAEGEVLVSQNFVTRLTPLEQQALLMPMADQLRDASMEAYHIGAMFDERGSVDFYRRRQTPFESFYVPCVEIGTSQVVRPDVMNRSFWYMTREILGDEAMEAGQRAWLRFSYDGHSRL